MGDKRLLVGDIGGTNARFALANSRDIGFHDVLELQCRNFENSGDAIRHYLDAVGSPDPEVICLAVAGPIIDGYVNVTNNHWEIAEQALATAFSARAVRLLNDFEAIALSVPFLGRENCVPIGGHGAADLQGRSFSVAVLGPGTGLGVAGLNCYGDVLVPVTGEGGHVGFAPESDLQLAILAQLRERFDRVSAERLVAGSGLQNIYLALAKIRGAGGDKQTPADIFAAAAGEPDGVAAEAVTVFFEILGQVAGDLALTLGASDGVYIAGGIAKRYPDVLASGGFRAAFESKGRHREIMERTPTLLITHEQPGLLGASYVALELSSSS